MVRLPVIFLCFFGVVSAQTTRLSSELKNLEASVFKEVDDVLAQSIKLLQLEVQALQLDWDFIEDTQAFDALQVLSSGGQLLESHAYFGVTEDEILDSLHPQQQSLIEGILLRSQRINQLAAETQKLLRDIDHWKNNRERNGDLKQTVELKSLGESLAVSMAAIAPLAVPLTSAGPEKYAMVLTLATSTVVLHNVCEYALSGKNLEEQLFSSTSAAQNAFEDLVEQTLQLQSIVCLYPWMEPLILENQDVIDPNVWGSKRKAPKWFRQSKHNRKSPRGKLRARKPSQKSGDPGYGAGRSPSGSARGRGY